jgi:putative ABC transport system permease protein
MFWIAWRMLIGNPGKYLGIVLGVAFATFLIAQQAAVFCGLMNTTAGQIRDIREVDLWVCNPGVQFIDDNLPMTDTALGRIRGVEGVAWAVPFFKGLGRARMSDGKDQQMIILGVDNGSFVGAPRDGPIVPNDPNSGDFFIGKLEDLRLSDAVIIDDAGYQQMWPDDGKNFRLGRTFEMNDRRAIVVGVCRASRTFQTFPIVYTRYSNAIQYIPGERRTMTYVLAKAKSGVDVAQVCKNIEDQTEFAAYPHQSFFWMTINYFLINTGIPFNFGLMIIMGFLVGAAVSGMLFYIFISDNIRQFGALKAMGMSNLRIIAMVFFQAVLIGVQGYAIGVGMAAYFGYATRGAIKLQFLMLWQIPVITLVITVAIILFASLFSLIKVLRVEPAIVFKG